MNLTKYKILFVEDDPVISYMIKDYLQKRNYKVYCCTNGEVAWQLFMKNIFDICLVDVLLPLEMNGYELVKNIRNKNTNIPIIMLSSKNLEVDKIEGYRSGADSYLTKPVNLKELEMRLAILIRRSMVKEETKHHIFKIGKIDFDHTNLTIKIVDTEYLLTQKEADLLQFFFKNTDRLITRKELLTKLWGKDDILLSKSLDTFVSRIRKYINPQHDARLETVPGQGFIFHGSLQKNNSTKTIQNQAEI